MGELDWPKSACATASATAATDGPANSITSVCPGTVTTGTGGNERRAASWVWEEEERKRRSARCSEVGVESVDSLLVAAPTLVVGVLYKGLEEEEEEGEDEDEEEEEEEEDVKAAELAFTTPNAARPTFACVYSSGPTAMVASPGPNSSDVTKLLLSGPPPITEAETEFSAGPPNNNTVVEGEADQVKAVSGNTVTSSFICRGEKEMGGEGRNHTE